MSRSRVVSFIAALLSTLLVLPSVRADEPAPPSNDNFADAEVIESIPFSDLTDMTAATREINEASDCYAEEHSIWYRYTPSETSRVGFFISGTVSYATLAIFTGEGLGALDEKYCSFMWRGDSSSFEFEAATTYYIHLSSYWEGTLGFNMYDPGQISGRVTNEFGEGIRFACVDAVSENHWSYTYTDEEGNYVLNSLPPGDYKISFSDCSGAWDYIAEWYDDKPQRAEADFVSVVSGQVTPGIDAELAFGGHITGTLTVPSGSGYVCVSAVKDGEAKAWTDQWGSGTYTLSGLPTGSYKVHFEPCWSANLIPEWYNDKPDEASADPVDVVQGEVTEGIDGELAPFPAPSNDLIENAIEISLPFDERVSLSGATPTSDPPTSCGTNGYTVWYQFEPAQPTTVAISGKGNSASIVTSVWTKNELGNLEEQSCLVSGSDSYAAVYAMPGTTYYLQVGARSIYNPNVSVDLSVHQTQEGGSAVLTSSLPCATLCPYWDQTKNTAAKYEASCQPSPTGPPGSWADINITVPGSDSFDGKVPTHGVFTLEPETDWDAFVCRKSPKSGKYFVTTDANLLGHTCPTAVVAGCVEAAIWEVQPGEEYVLRAYNWSDLASVRATWSYKLADATPPDGPTVTETAG